MANLKGVESGWEGFQFHTIPNHSVSFCLKHACFVFTLTAEENMEKERVKGKERNGRGRNNRRQK